MPIMNGYIAFYMPEHHLASSSGLVFEHQLKAEEKLGRKLLDGEVVHHIDKNRSDNAYDNLIVFETKADHTAFHRYNCDEKLLNKNSNGSYKITRKAVICPQCGGPKDCHASVCLACYNLNGRDRRVQRPSKDELYNLLKENKGNFTKVSKIYGLTDNAIRKWCKAEGLPFRSADYKIC